MTTRLARALRAFRTNAVLAAFLAVLPKPAPAIQLHWSGGATDLSVSQNTRALLIVSADSAEITLPGEWRLLWTADSSGIQFIAPESPIACQTDTAKVSSIDPPSTPAESAANLLTAHFCSDGSAVAPIAYWAVDLVGGGRGKLKVVALDPALGANIESNEATYNGGIDGDYPSAVLAASSSHPANQFVVHTIGSGLSQVASAIAQAPDSLWSLPLQITQQSDSSLTAVAEVYASMPTSVLRLTNQSGAVTAVPLAPDGMREGIDPDFDALADSCRVHHCYYFDPDPNVYPRDFTFFYAIAQNPVQGLFHLFYIREHRTAVPNSTSRSFGHAWSQDLRNWEADTSAAVFSVSSDEWDRAHVWAPSIVQVGPNYHMFYTGVDATNQDEFSYGNQRIGYATTAAIETGSSTVWTRRSEPTYTVNRTGWARRDSLGTHRQQFRDPFIMADPDSAGRYLLFRGG